MPAKPGRRSTTSDHSRQFLEPIALIPNQRQEFRARLLLFAETAEHGGGHGGGMLLFYPAHHHAEMAGFNHDADALRLDSFFNGLGNFRGPTLLGFQGAGKE